jgi:hypothetical protein
MEFLTIEEALHGKRYRGSRGEGAIISAEKRVGVWAGQNHTAYAVEVQPFTEYGKTPAKTFWATIAVKTENL